MQFSPLDSSKMEVLKTCLFDIVTTQYDDSSYLKHILGRIWLFFTLFGYWVLGWGGGGGSPKGLVHNLLMQFFTLDNSKVELFKTCLFDIVTTQYYDPSYLKHIFGPYSGVFHPIWVLGWGGGVSQGIGTQPAHAVFPSGQLQNGSFQNLFF